ncbi:MAG TPA: BtrH N-terminal domain-containing protein [Methanocella sp.]|nr:BtrH N-terminal domain-containing protein [Methanocella sp.]
MATGRGIEPFDRCPALDGYHCNTNSLMKIYHRNDRPLSEDMLLGLGAGMSFIYWHPKGGYPFVGGRGNNKGFYSDLGRRTGVKIIEVSTGSGKKAEAALVERLRRREPVMVYGDMGCLPWFDMPEGYHFGGHTFVICGYDGDSHVLVSDMDPKACGLKKGFYSAATLAQLRLARGSKEKPFPPGNRYFDFDFGGYHDPAPEDINESIRQAADAMLNPPIKNLGVSGIRHAARELLKWPDKFDDNSLMMNLFNLYVFIEIGGTGGGCFRYMYARFLRESAQITGNQRLQDASKILIRSGQSFTEVGMLFHDYGDASDLSDRISRASDLLMRTAAIEEETFKTLRSSIA